MNTRAMATSHIIARRRFEDDSICVVVWNSSEASHSWVCRASWGLHSSDSFPVTPATGPPSSAVDAALAGSGPRVSACRACLGFHSAALKRPSLTASPTSLTHAHSPSNLIPNDTSHHPMVDITVLSPPQALSGYLWTVPMTSCPLLRPVLLPFTLYWLFPKQNYYSSWALYAVLGW